MVPSMGYIGGGHELLVRDPLRAAQRVGFAGARRFHRKVEPIRLGVHLIDLLRRVSAGTTWMGLPWMLPETYMFLLPLLIFQ